MSERLAQARGRLARLLPSAPLRRALLVVICVYAIELLQSWLTTRPVALLLASLPLDDAELFEPGGLYLLEVARLERSSLLPAALLTLRLLALAWLLGLPARALLVRQATDRETPTPEAEPRFGGLGRLSLWLGLEQLLFLGFGGVLAVIGGLVLGLTGAAWALLEHPLWLALFAISLFAASVFLQLWADATALRLAHGRRFFFALAQSLPGRRSLNRLGARALKSLLVLGGAALGLGLNHRRVDQDTAWLELSLTALALSLIALDLAWYAWLDVRLDRPGLSEPRRPLADRSASSGEPACPTPDLGA
jgi:hypothetical protein